MSLFILRSSDGHQVTSVLLEEAGECPVAVHAIADLRQQLALVVRLIVPVA